MLISISSINSCIDKTVIKNVIESMRFAGYTTKFISNLDNEDSDAVVKKAPELISSIGMFNSDVLFGSKSVIRDCMGAFISNFMQGIVKLDYILSEYADAMDSDCIYFTDYDIPSMVMPVLTTIRRKDFEDHPSPGNAIYKAVRDFYKYFYVDREFSAYGGLDKLSSKSEFKQVYRFCLDYPVSEVDSGDTVFDPEFLKTNYKDFINSFGVSASNAYYLLRLVLETGNNVLYKSSIFKGFEVIRPSNSEMPYELMNKEFISKLVGRSLKIARKERLRRSNVKIALC